MKLSPAAFSYQCDVVEDGKVRGSAFGPMSTVDALGNMPVSVAIDDRDKTKHDADPSHPHVPWSKTVLYELHVKGLTANAPWLPKELRGTYAGLGPPDHALLSAGSGRHLHRAAAHPGQAGRTVPAGARAAQLLGVLATQLLLPRAFVRHCRSPAQGARPPCATRSSAWCARCTRPASRSSWTWCTTTRAKAAWKARRSAGAVWTSCLYYRRQKCNIGRFEDTTGCGNTLDFTNTHVVTFAVDSLRYWAKRIGIDGFRFDLGVALARLDGTSPSAARSSTPCVPICCSAT